MRKNNRDLKKQINGWMKRTGRTHGLGMTGGRGNPESAVEAFRRKPYDFGPRKEQDKGDQNGQK